MPTKPLTLVELMEGPADPLYEILPKFVEAKGVDIPTVNLTDEGVDELRALLIQWQDGKSGDAEIINKFALPDDPNVYS